jgi:integrase
MGKSLSAATYLLFSTLTIGDRFIGLGGASFRRSELAAIDFTNLSFTEDGLIIDLHRSKTDQEGAGRKVGIPFGTDVATCLVRALRRWLRESGIAGGAAFRAVNHHGKIFRRGLHKDCVGWILKRAAQLRLEAGAFGGHSLRAGCVTQAAMNGVSERDIMRQTGHKSAEMLAKYIRIGEMLTRNAAAGLGI